MIRDIRKTDFDGLRELMRQVHKLHAANRPDVYNDIDPLTREYFDFLLNDENTVTLVCDIDSFIAAYCVASFKEIPQNPLLKKRRIAIIEALCVDEDHRKQGLGKLIFDEAASRLKAMGAEGLELTVWSFNEDAIRFYESMGMDCRSFTMEKVRSRIMDHVEYNKDKHGEPDYPEGFLDLIAGLSVSEQLKFFRIGNGLYCKQPLMERRKRRYDYSNPVEQEEAVKSLIVNNGVIAGVMVKDCYGHLVPCMAENAYVCDESDSEVDGSGYKEYQDYHYLVCVPENFDEKE